MTDKAFWVYGDHAGVKEPIYQSPDRKKAEQWAKDYARDNPDIYQEISIEEGSKDKPAY
ncbi:hypothetical protein G6M17_07860 [Agrobacterium tumefaciens]|uniref:hypothetical protein n=1 Tax=Rhizobium/Agrobacterium group TaxID=227290 RepID=UPI001374718E|nr:MULTISPECIES: hypothetical protein [Rhizobium/Agrobacterium group]MCZ7443077.1 hypothetical protein [Rhizobium rhizogenes]NSZ79063.1 hypothetical protein [Agrobacterium tumefaciens]